MHSTRILLVLLMLIACHARLVAAAEAPKVDLLLTGGTIVDGSGGEPYAGNVAVREDRIVAVGDVGDVAAERTIDCKGLVICPGFIDLHNHSDHGITADTRDARCYLTQGCTTIVTGNCGGGRHDVGKFYDELAADGVGINIAQLVPHGSIRDKVMGKVRRAPTEKELEQMQQLADEGMQEGAWGMSTGLQYVPGAYADTDELVAIATMVSKHGGIYASHMRDESDELMESIEEVLQIARRANMPCHISHLKSSKPRNWGKIRAATQVVAQARQSGLRITADQYPYTASSTSIMAMLLPDEEREGGEEATSERLQNPDELARVRPIVAKSIDERGQLMIASFVKNPAWVGKLIGDVAKAEGKEQVEIGLELLTDAKAQGVNFGMDEADVRYAMTMPWVATASDGSSKIDDGTRPHPRSYGTFPRKIGRYAIKDKVLPLPAAIRSASGLPADIIGMKDRGYVRENLAADLVVFDPNTFEDRATYEKPFENSTGVRWLLLNGKVAIADGEPQAVLAGRPLRRNAEDVAAGQ
ncbi:MAG: D-aminoacylase [Planctomycetes bacterium]|nr:D-aminoacylase [Planctomycetota bacterium]